MDPTSAPPAPGASPASQSKYPAPGVTAKLAKGLLAVAIVVTATEFLIMEAIGRWSTKPWTLWEPTLDSVTLLCVLVPVLVLFFVRPMLRSFRELGAAQDELRAARDELEVRVQARTAELMKTNLALQREIDERLQADRRVRLQAGLLDAVEQAVVATDPGGRVVFWNRFAESLFGWKEGEAQGQRLEHLVTFRQGKGRSRGAPEECETSGSWVGEAEAERRDGSRFPVHLACSPIRDPRGETMGHVYLSFDITDRKKAEEALRYSEEKYSTLVESSPTGIFIVQDGRLVFVNPALARMLGCSPDELTDTQAASIVHPEDRECVREIAEKRRAGETVPGAYECRLVAKTGETRRVTMRNILVPYRDSVVTLGNVQDVTEQKKMEEELRRQSQDLRRLSDRLVAAQEAERRRVAAELHDSIGQSLTGIKFVLEGSLGAPWPNERREQVARLRTLIPMIQAAVEEVRRVSMALRPSTLDDLGLVATITWFGRDFESTYPGIELRQRIEVEESDIPERPKTAIYRIAQEATNNAVKHSGARRIILSLGKSAGALELTVQDNGIGFDATTAGKEKPGLGFGLILMRERAELTGGSFSLESTKGVGTTLRASWPLKPIG